MSSDRSHNRQQELVASDEHGLVLITGGAGFIGQYVARIFVDAGTRVRALDILAEQVHRHPHHACAQFPGEVVVGDVRDKRVVSRAAVGCTGIIHLAAETGTGQSMYEKELYTAVNVEGTRNVLEVAEAAGIPVVVASSRAVYGEGPRECHKHGRQHGGRCCDKARLVGSVETDPLNPVSVYGETKVAAEALALDARTRGVRVITVRPQNVVGAGQALHNPYTGVLAAFAARLRNGEAPLVYGRGTQTRDFIDVEDVARIIVWLYQRPDIWERVPVINVGSGRSATLLDLAEAACRAVGVDLAVEHVDIRRPGDIDHARADLTLASRIGLPVATTDLATSVKRFIDFANDDAPVDPGLWDSALTELHVDRTN